jgi:hypothetical protein
MRTRLLLILAPLALALAAPSVLAQASPPASPTDYPMYSVEASTSSVTVGESTATPETISHNPQMDLDEVPYAPGNAYYDEDGTTPADHPEYAASPSGNDCLSDDIGASADTFTDLLNRSIYDAFHWISTIEATDGLEDIYDTFFDWGDKRVRRNTQNLVYCTTYAEPSIYFLWYGGWYAGNFDPVQSGCVCGLHTPGPPLDMPTYAEASDFYDAAGVFRKKVEAIDHNWWYEINLGPSSNEWLIDAHVNYTDRLDLALKDFLFDLYAAHLNN